MTMLPPEPPELERYDEVVLVAITDFDRIPAALSLERAERLARSARPGTLALQLRDRTRSARELVSLGTRLLEVARSQGQRLVVNDRLDFAKLFGIRGVHLGEGSVETADARRWLDQPYVFRACHDPDRVDAIEAEAVLLSPVLASRKGNAALGLAALSEARARLERGSKGTRLFALGGVEADSARACIAAGAHGVAAIGAAFETDDPEPLLRALAIFRD